MSVVLKLKSRSAKNVAISDFENMRKEHIHKQINFLMMQVTNELETKFDIGYEYSYQNR